MAPGQDTQLEKAIDEALKSGDVQPLDVFLQSKIQDVSPIKCSQQFLTKLDKLVSRSLDKRDYKSAGLGLNVFCKCGENLKLPGGQGLPGIIAKGLLKKWFEKCRQLWIQCGPQWDESLFNLSEDFLDVLMVVHDSCEEGKYNITESFLYPVGQLAVDTRIHILIRKEAIHKFNLILDKIPVTLKKKKKIITSQEASDIMIKLAGQILEGGDFDFQTALMEALCRMATSNQRKELADRWFSMEHVASAFVKIHDSEFETDCRKFLNLVNGMQGDTKRVYSYPCLEAYLDKHELLMPADEKLEEFWIDFNLGSHSLSFYFSLADGEAQWETICITENEVKSYTITEEGKRCIMQLKLSEVVIVGAVEGSSLTIHFSSSLDILHATRSIYGQSKNIGFVGKTGTSVVKTAVKIRMEETSSQVVPESQVSLGEKKKNTAYDLLPAPSASVQMVTPAKMKMSESNTVFSGSPGRSVNGARSLSAMQSSKGKGKPSLEMVRSRVSIGEFNQAELRTTAKTCNHGTMAAGMIEQSDASQQNTASKQSRKKKVDKHQKNIPEAKAVDVFLAGQKEEQSMERTYVPDTQPSSGRNIRSSWSRLSVSERLVMPPQKMNSLPRPEPCLSLSQQQEGQSSEQRSSVPFHRPISQKQLRSEVTQRPKQIISERNQSPAPQDPVEPQRKMSDVREDSRDSTDRWTPKEQTNGLTNRKSKGRMSLNVDVTLIKALAKVSTTKPLKKRTPLSVKAETKRALSSKEKRDAELAGNMVKLISSRYDSTPKDAAEDAPKSRNTPVVNRPIFNMTWLSTVKRDVAGAGSVMRRSKTGTSSTQRREDIFTFNPVSPLSTEGKDRTFNNTSATLSSGTHESSALLNTTKKGQPVAKEKRHVKKHLFSDTDTDCAMTEVSWLRESSRKSKPKVAKYSRQVPVKPKALSTHASYDSIDLTRSSEKPVKYRIQPNKNKPVGKERLRQQTKTVTTAAAPNRPHAASRRPQRASATYTKSYKEQDTDDNQSESDAPSVSKNHFIGQKRKNEKSFSEVPQVKMRTRTSSERSTDTCSKLNSKNQSHLKKPCGLKQRRPENVVAEMSKLQKRDVSPAQEQMHALMDPLAACQTSSCPSTPYIEGMRSAERPNSNCSPSLTPWGSPLPASPNPSCQDTPLPILLLPKPCSTVSSKGKIKPSPFYSAERKHKSQFIQSASTLPSLTPVGHPPVRPNAAEISPIHQSQITPPLSPLPSLPLFTSTLLELGKPSMFSPPQSTFSEDTVTHSSHYGFHKVSLVSQVCLSLSSTLSSVHNCTFNDSPTAAPAITSEKSPSSNQDLKLAQLLISGPSRKRRISSSSNFEEDNKEEKKKSKMRRQCSPRMKPRKLFKSFADEVSGKSEASQVMSLSHMESSCYWKAEEGDGDTDIDEDFELPKADVYQSNLCQQFSSERKERFENRYKMGEIYNKQSMKTVQHYASSLNIQVASYRTERREQLQDVLLEEISKLEHNESLLKSMEKDLTLYWRKHSLAFCSYKEQENRRNETLTKAFQSNVCHSLEYEERLFTSQMCLMRKDMKSVQDRLLSQMQKEELQNVKRGLCALFFP